MSSIQTKIKCDCGSFLSIKELCNIKGEKNIDHRSVRCPNNCLEIDYHYFTKERTLPSGLIVIDNLFNFYYVYKIIKETKTTYGKHPGSIFTTYADEKDKRSNYVRITMSKLDDFKNLTNDYLVKINTFGNIIERKVSTDKLKTVEDLLNYFNLCKKESETISMYE
jgi:hypothetical protein